MLSLFRKCKLDIGRPTKIKLRPSLNVIFQESNRNICTNEDNFKSSLFVHKSIAPKLVDTGFHRSFTMAKLETFSMDNNIPSFMSTFPDIVQEVKEVVKEYTNEDLAYRVSEAVKYNVPHGKMFRGNFMIAAFRSLVKDASPEQIKLAHYLGWCIELLHTLIILADDIVDNGEERRGRPCWYKVKEIGMTSVVEMLQFQNAIYAILKKHFRHLDCYVDLIELYRMTGFATLFGQSEDMIRGNLHIDTFSNRNYRAFALAKSSYVTFCIPFTAAWYFSGYKDAIAYEKIEAILIEMGYLFQINNDFLDCYGDPKIIGKMGTDIESNKCSWLAAWIMENANEEHKSILRDCYGQNDPDKVKRVKQLYLELDMPNIYQKEHDGVYNKLKTEIHQLPDNLPINLLLEVLKKNYNRET